MKERIVSPEQLRRVATESHPTTPEQKKHLDTMDKEWLIPLHKELDKVIERRKRYDKWLRRQFKGS